MTSKHILMLELLNVKRQLLNNRIDKLQKKINKRAEKKFKANLSKAETNDTDDRNGESKNIPPPPTLNISEPKVRYSSENFKDPMPKKPNILNDWRIYPEDQPASPEPFTDAE